MTTSGPMCVSRSLWRPDDRRRSRSGRTVLLRQIPFGPDGGLGTVGDADALEQTAAMRLDRLLTDPERGGDLLVLATVHDQAQHLEFTPCELRGRSVQLPAASQQVSRNRRAQRRAAIEYRTDAGDEDFGLDVLDEVPVSAGIERADDLLRIAVRDQSDHCDVGLRRDASPS